MFCMKSFSCETGFVLHAYICSFISEMPGELEFELKAIIPTDTSDGGYTVYIFNSERKIIIPIITNRWACESILLAKDKIEMPRPHIHNTFMRTLLATGTDFKGISIYKYLDDVFYAYLILESAGEIYEIDTRVTDAISLALLYGKPLIVQVEVYTVAGILIDKDLIQKSLES